MKKVFSMFLGFLLLFVSVPLISNAESIANRNVPRVFKEGHCNEEVNFYRIGNKIYVNGVHEATIVESTLSYNTTADKDLGRYMPRTGWVYTAKCPFGTPSDYTKHIATKTRNIQLERDNDSRILIVLCAVIGRVFSSIPQEIAIGIAGRILGNLPGSNYGNLKTLYFKEDIYGHQSLGGIYRKNILKFYFDPNFTEYATTETMYSWWG